MNVSRLRAAYTAERTAGLAGVPVRTLYYWASHGILEPSVSNQRTRLWSYGDVLLLRLIDWLRRDKDLGSFPRSSMVKIRALLSSVEALGDVPEEGLPVSVDSTGRIVLHLDGIQYVPIGRAALQAQIDFGDLDLLLPYRDTGPDLRWPRPSLRILPGKLSGQPHVAETRIETAALAALGARGFTFEEIVELYPTLTADNVAEALDLEQQISHVA